MTIPVEERKRMRERGWRSQEDCDTCLAALDEAEKRVEELEQRAMSAEFDKAERDKRIATLEADLSRKELALSAMEKKLQQWQSGKRERA